MCWKKFPSNIVNLQFRGISFTRISQVLKKRFSLQKLFTKIIDWLELYALNIFCTPWIQKIFIFAFYQMIPRKDRRSSLSNNSLSRVRRRTGQVGVESSSRNGRWVCCQMISTSRLSWRWLKLGCCWHWSVPSQTRSPVSRKIYIDLCTFFSITYMTY